MQRRIAVAFSVMVLAACQSAGNPVGPVRDTAAVEDPGLLLAPGLVWKNSGVQVLEELPSPKAFIPIPRIAPYVATDLGFGGLRSRATGINDLGQVVGYSVEDSAFRIAHALLWDNGTVTDLGSFGGTFALATGINNRGQVVGSSQYEDGTFHAFLWENGVMTDLGTLGGGSSSGLAINDLGQVTGASTRPCPFCSGNEAHAFLWQDGVMTDLGALGGYSQGTGIGVRGQVVGWTIAGAFLWEEGTMTALSTRQSAAQGINGLRQVVGRANGHAFLWEDGTMEDLGTLVEGGGSAAYGINSFTQVVGGSDGHAVLWDGGTITDLGTLGGPASIAYTINDFGQIVGESQNADGESRAVLWTQSLFAARSLSAPPARSALARQR